MCLQIRCDTAAEDEENSETAYDDLTQEEDNSSNVSVVEEGVSQSNPTDEDTESKSEASVPAVRRQGKKRRDRTDSNILAIKNIGKLVSTSTDVMKQNAERRNAPQQQQEDKDWIFAKLIYQKMSEIPEGVEKDDLQVDIQRLINDSRRRIVSCQQAGSTWSAANIPVQQYTSSAQFYQQQPPNPYTQGAQMQQHPTFSSTGAAVDLYSSANLYVHDGNFQQQPTTSSNNGAMDVHSSSNPYGYIQQQPTSSSTGAAMAAYSSPNNVSSGVEQCQWEMFSSQVEYQVL